MNQHWSEKYIGLPYELGVLDCALLATTVRRNEFGMEAPSDIDVERSKSRLGRVAQMGDAVSEYGEKTDNPVEGDAVLMICRGRPSHVGIYCLIDGIPYVLHAMENAKMVVLHKISQLNRVFLSVEGFYKWKTLSKKS